MVAALWLLLDLGLGIFAFSLGFRITAAQIALAAVLIAVVGLQLLGQRILRPTPLDKPLLLYAIALALGVLGQRASGASLIAPDAQGVYRLASVILLTGAVGTGERAVRLAKIFVVAASLQGLYGVVQHFTGLELIGSSTLRLAPFTTDRFVAMGSYTRHTTHAYVTTAGLVFLSAALLTSAVRGPTRWLAIALSLPAGFGGLFTFVRTAWGGLAVGLGAMAVVGRRFKKAVAVFAVLAALGTGAVVVTPSLRERAARAIDPAVDGNWHRGFMWARTLEMIVDHPVTGIGAGTFTQRTHQYYDPLVDDWRVRCHAHNNLLFVWAESGPLGLLAFFWVFGAAIAALRRGAKAVGPGAEASRAVILGAAGVAGMFLAWSALQDPLYDGVIAYTTAFALALGFAAAGPAAAPLPHESVAFVEPRPPSPQDELDDLPPPAHMSAGVAAAGIACAALGGFVGSQSATAGEGVVALFVLLLGCIGYLPLLPPAPAAALRGLAIFAGAVVLAMRPFAAVLVPGSGPWWTSPSAGTAVAALVAGFAGASWAIRRPGLVGPAPVAGALLVSWAAGWIALLEYVLFRWFAVDHNPGRPFAYNFAVGTCAAALLFVAWAGPLGFGTAEVKGAARRVVQLPAAVVAAGLLVLAVAGLT